MTAPVITWNGTRAVAIACERPAREPELELERAARFALGCAGLVRPQKVEWVAREALPVEVDAPGALVVQYADSGAATLADRIASGQAESAPVGRWLIALADSLSSLHDLGVAHGHLRADLIAVRGDALAVLGYGVEAAARAVGGAGLAVSALPERYRAPEQDGSQPSAASPWSDTFAFGVIARELIPEALNDGQVRELIDRATAEPLARRPADLRQLARELDEALRERAAAIPIGEASAPIEPPPEPEPLEPPPEAPPVAPPPPPQPPQTSGPVALPPLSQRSPARSSTAFVLAMIAGAVLMVVGVGALFVVAVVRGQATTAPVATVSAVDAGSFAVPVPDAAAPSPIPIPHLLSDAGTDDDDSDASSVPTPVPEVSSAEIPPRAVSAADALAALPLDERVPVWGEPDAPATLVLFGDLECPHTRRSIAVALSLKKALGEDLRLAWRHRPLAENTLARSAAEIASALHAEHDNGVFWRFVAAAGKDGAAPTEARLGQWIEAAGGDRARVMAAQKKHASRVDRDLELAGRFDVRATPTWFLNGIRFEGFQERADLERQAQQEIGVARVALASGVDASGIYATRVRKNLIGLGPNVTLRTCPELGKSPGRGASSPLVTIVEFSDFQCPHCRRVQPTLERVLSRFGGDVRLVWKNLPLASHGRARPAAALALEALSRGGAPSFWRVHDLLFDGSHGLDDDGLKKIAEAAGLEPTSALDAVRRGAHDAAIDTDIDSAKRLGAKGTPTFYLNGRKLEGAVSYEKLSAIVREEIDAARRLIDNGTARARVYAAICGSR